MTDRGQQRPAAGPAILQTEIGGDISLYDPATERVAVLNGTASDVWRLCDGESTVTEIVAILSRAYAVGTADIGSQVAGVVDDLAAQGFLTMADGPA